MNESKDKDDTSLFCESCGIRIQVLKALNNPKDDEFTFCRYCGSAIEIKNIFKQFNIPYEEKYENKSTDNEEQEIINKHKYPIERVYYDPDFPKIFKQNLIIVISRLIYDIIRDVEKYLKQKINKRNLKSEVLNSLEEFILPITEKKIKKIYLKNLYKDMKIEEFEVFLTMFQEKIKRNPLYKSDVDVYLKWIISHIFIIIKEKWNSNKLSNFYKVIRHDLVHYLYLKKKKNFSSKINSNKNSTKKLKEIISWKKLFEELGSYGSIRSKLIKEFGFAPDQITIKNYLKEYFDNTDENFIEWEKKFRFRWYYSKSEVRSWISIFESIGDFENVGVVLKKKYNKKIKGEVVRRNIQKLFEQEGRDFYKWYYKNANPRSIRYTQTEALKLWIPLYEEIGSWNGVERHLQNKYKIAPSHKTISLRVKKVFHQKGWDFKKWYTKYSLEFTNSDVKMWKLLYEQLGTFFELQFQLEQYYQDLNKKHPTFTTITNRLKNYINQMNKIGELKYNYEEWKQKYYSRSKGFDDRTKNRIEIDVCERKKIFKELQQRGYRLKDIYRTLGIHTKIFHKSYPSLNLEIFEKLKELLGRDIPYKIKLAYGKWMKYTFSDFVEYFKKILTPELKIILKLKNSQAPSTPQLVLHGHGDFVSALKNYNIKYEEIIDEIGLIAPKIELKSLIGLRNHPILEYIFMKFAKENDLLSFYEIMPSRKDNQKRCDNTIIRDKKFIELIEKNQNLIKFLDNIKMINIDYQLGLDIPRIIKKSFRGYHGGDKHLIIVILTTKQKIQVPQNIPFKNNFSILNAEEFCCFLGFNEKYSNNFMEMIEFSIDSFYYDYSFTTLESLSKLAKNKLSEEFSENQNEKLEEYLRKKNLMYLLKKNKINLNKSSNQNNLMNWLRE